MFQQVSFQFRRLVLLALLLVLLTVTTVSAQQSGGVIVPVNPSPTPAAPTLSPIPPSPTIGGQSVQMPVFVPPPTLDDLLAKYPDLRDYLAQIENLAPKDIDFAELYRRMVTIYDEQGAGGLAVFLSDSGLLDKLGVPQSYLDFLRVYDSGGMQAVSDLAHERGVVNDQNELLAWIAIDDKANLQAMTETLQGLGVTVYNYMPNTQEVEVGIPLDILAQYQSPGGLLGYLVAVANVPHAVGVRPPTPQAIDSFTLQQAMTSVGSDRVGATAWHAAGFTGKGIKIGIIDAGFGGIDTLLGSDLPANIKANAPISALATSPVDHGTAVAVVVHRAAPDAELYIADMSGGDAPWQAALQYMAQNHVQIVSHSVGSVVGPQDGTWGHSVDVDSFVRQTGALWVNSAGNYAERHLLIHFKADKDGFHDYGGGNLVPFQPVQDATTIALSWDGNWQGGETNNYRIFVYDQTNKVVASAAEARTGQANDFPIQLLQANLTAGNIYYLGIQEAPGTTGNNTLNVILPDSDTIDAVKVRDHSVTAPGDSASVLTAGATHLTSDDIETFSSRGPTFANLPKPDISAPDGEQVFGFMDADGFLGTSASAPLTAGIAALVLQAHPEFTAPQLKAFLIAGALDLGDPGADNVFGAGRLMLAAPNAAPATPVSTGNVVAKLYDLNAQFGVTENGVTGVLFTVSFAVDNAAGRQIAAAVSARDASGAAITSPDANFTFGGTVGTSQIFTVNGNSGAFSGVTLFLPDSTLGWVAPGTQMSIMTGIYDVTDPAHPVALKESDPLLITIAP